MKLHHRRAGVRGQRTRARLRRLSVVWFNPVAGSTGSRPCQRGVYLAGVEPEVWTRVIKQNPKFAAISALGVMGGLLFARFLNRR